MKFKKILKIRFWVFCFCVGCDYVSYSEFNEPKKKFHRLTHICPIWLQWKKFDRTSSRFRIEHFENQILNLKLFWAALKHFLEYLEFYKIKEAKKNLTKFKQPSAPKFSQLDRRRHLKMWTWGSTYIKEASNSLCI